MSQTEKSFEQSKNKSTNKNTRNKVDSKGREENLVVSTHSATYLECLQGL